MPRIGIEEVAGGIWIAVRQIQPGIRFKVPFTPREPPPGNEALAHAIF
jgi:hypothetical protein